jgi:2-phosphosulfolactate phosphatase
VKSPHSQHQYQVRFDWGTTGARVVGDGADVVVWVDVLAGAAWDPPEVDAIVIAGSLNNRRAVADWVLARQGDKGDRFTVAVVAVGELQYDASPRFALEDLLAAGAIIDALADLGIDYCSPEAAAASASFTGLRNATAHLIGSSGSGQELTRAGRRGEVDEATDLDVSSEVPILREFPHA